MAFGPILFELAGIAGAGWEEEHTPRFVLVIWRYRHGHRGSGMAIMAAGQSTKRAALSTGRRGRKMATIMIARQ